MIFRWLVFGLVTLQPLAQATVICPRSAGTEFIEVIEKAPGIVTFRHCDRKGDCQTLGGSNGYRISDLVAAESQALEVTRLRGFRGGFYRFFDTLFMPCALVTLAAIVTGHGPGSLGSPAENGILLFSAFVTAINVAGISDLRMRIQDAKQQRLDIQRTLLATFRDDQALSRSQFKGFLIRLQNLLKTVPEFIDPSCDHLVAEPPS